MLGILTSVLPTIGKIVGTLLNNLKGDGTEELKYVAYNLDPDSTSEIATCQAVFTKQDDQIILTNAGFDRSKAIRMHFPNSPLEENDDIVLEAQSDCLVNDIFKTHAEYEDGRFELTAVDVDANRNAQDEGAGHLMHRTRKAEVPTDGSSVSFGSFFTVSLQGQCLKFALTPSYPGTIYAVDYVIVSSVEDSSGQSYRLENQINPESSDAISLTLPAPFANETAQVTVEARIDVQSGRNAELLKKMGERCRPIGERTKYIIQNGRCMNGEASRKGV